MAVRRRDTMRTISFWVVIGLLAALVAGLAVLLAILMNAAGASEPAMKKFLARLAWFTLVLLGVAVVLLLWSLLRLVRHRLRPLPTRQRQYVDAWAEAGRRVQVDEDEEDETPGASEDEAPPGS